MLKYLREAIELRRQAKDLYKAEKRLEQSELDYLMFEKIVKNTNREITIKFANGTTLIVKDSKNGSGFTPFEAKYNQLHS